MTTQTLPRTSHEAVPTPRRVLTRLSWRSLRPDLTYLTSGFFVSLISFIVLTTFFVVGLATLVIWIGAPILAFTLFLATGFARENREQLAAWGVPVADPTYRGRSSRMLTMLVDPQAWGELLHGTLVAFPLRLATFVVPVSWVAGALGGLTWWVWGRFLPEDEFHGAAWLMERALGLDISANWYVAESIWMFVAGVLLLATAPLVARVCCSLDAAVSRALLGGPGAQR